VTHDGVVAERFAEWAEHLASGHALAYPWGFSLHTVAATPCSTRVPRTSRNFASHAG
jgi:hypothetical protein